MALEGTIQDFGLADIIQFLRQQTKTGVLSIQSGEQRTKVYFKDGMIVSAATDETEGIDWLVQRFLRSGYVSEPQLKQFLEQYPDPGRFGAGLQESGLVTQQDLKRFFEFQTQETLFTLFRLKEGTYRFEPTPFDNPQYDITPHDPNFILLEGMRQLDEWPMIKKKISSENTIFEKKHDLIDKVCISQEDEISFGEEETEVKTKDKKYGITGTEMAVYQLVDGRRNVQQLVDRALIGEFYTYKALGSLISQGLIDPAGEAVTEVPKLIKTSSVSKVWSTVLLAVAFAWGIIFAPGLLNSLLSFPIPAEFLEDKISERNAMDLEEAVIIFYYKNMVLPMTLKELTADIPETQSLMDKLSRRGLRYYLEDDGFYLKINYNL